MLPHERALVQRLKSKPFALLGVNSDPVADVPRIFQENGITWRNVLAGSVDGELPQAWGVGGWPTIYVLDSKGVIRFGDVRDEEMDRAVDSLLAEIDAAK